jgi:hypothetical protein
MKFVVRPTEEGDRRGKHAHVVLLTCWVNAETAELAREQWCIRNHIPINLIIAQDRLLPMPASGAVRQWRTRQPGDGDATVPSPSESLEDVISRVPINKENLHGERLTAA